MTEECKLNIFQKINEIRKVVKYAKKDKTVGEGGYAVVTHDLITSISREAFIKFGVVCVPNLIKAYVLPTGTFTKNQVPFIRYEATYQFDFVNIDDPTDRIPIVLEAHAIDQGDKAPGKTLSYGKKMAVLKLLEIETGEEEESRDEQFRHKEGKKENPVSAEAVMREQLDKLDDKRKSVVTDYANAAIDLFLQEDNERAYDLLQKFNETSDAEEQMALWHLLPKEYRKIIKAIKGERKRQVQIQSIKGGVPI